MTVIKYDDFVTDFSVASILQNFVGNDIDGLNVCEEICDRHATDEHRVAYRLTGDVVVNNGDGSHSYTGRDDDIIASAGYRIGPAEVESTLLEHEAVIESAVIGKPDAKRGTIVKAYVVIHPDFDGDEALVEKLQQHVRKRLSTHSFPREIEFLDELPKTSSGKIQRFLLRQQATDESGEVKND